MVNRDIDYVMQVAQCGGIQKAAENLYITPSALSKYIYSLEEKYGIRIFDRIGKKFMLTYAGERYLYWIQRQANIITEMESELSDIAGSMQGTVKIGIPLALSDFWVENILIDFKKKYPQIRVQLIEDVSTNIAKMLLNNELDFTVSEVDSQHSNIIYEHLFDEAIVIAAAKSDTSLQNRSIDKGRKYPWLPIDVCSSQNLILPYQNQAISKFINSQLTGSGIKANCSVMAKSVSTLMKCVSYGLGITIMPDSPILFSEYKNHLQLFTFSEKPITRSWMISRHKDRYLTESANYAIDLTRSKYRKLFSQLLS